MALHDVNSFSLLFILLPALTLFLVSNQSHAVTTSPSSPKGIVLQVTKDPATLQYTTLVQQRTPLVPIKLTVDLGEGSLWVSCEDGYKSSTFKNVRCRSAHCALARSIGCGNRCAYSSNHLPNCTKNACLTLAINPFSGNLNADGEAVEDVLLLQSTSGQVVSAPHFVFNCVPSHFTFGLASGVKGVAGLGSTLAALPTQLAQTFSFRRKFLICLSSSTRANAGVVVFGDSGRFPTHKKNNNTSDRIYKSLIYTPLLKNPMGKDSKGRESSEYYVGLTSIKVNGNDVPFNTKLLSFDYEGGGGTKISTAHPYTVLERSIYQAVLMAFNHEIPLNVTRLNTPIEPFGACFRGITPNLVPPIDFVFQNQKTVWRISGNNLMARIDKDVICLAIVELPSLKSDTTEYEFERKSAVTIGAHQIEEHLLVFDLPNSMVGFSPSLLYRKTTCSSFKV
ncbi:OLC1v1035007C1 [Oldenlandia corymbosa var. corymbosa]|uniref:OLC1v1035007C1 n=1 Tax=Oldenlandia corymbosa var. corymbosa TaxID=529605 RepID=A0AAV1CSQ2_OLDCO|nr:OLC1v1035007C1 [Oldenlandia corymbosa var. corymbosa]